MSFDVVIWALFTLFGYLLWILISAARSGRLAALYHQHFREKRRERLFLASTAFIIAFAIVRVISWANHNGRGPFHDIYLKGLHVHHLVWGILLLLLVGYGWLAGIGAPDSNPWVGGIVSILYGIGAALTLDEFALWLNLRDVYWSEEGKESVRVALLFGGLLSMEVWGESFLQAATREALRILRRKAAVETVGCDSPTESDSPTGCSEA